MDRINTLDFEVFDPVVAGEEWALSWGSDYKVTEIYIDGRKLLDIIREIELPYAIEEGRIRRAAGYAGEDEDFSDHAGKYGHLSPKELYMDLNTEAAAAGDPNNDRAYLFCCENCGEIFCWTVSMKVREDERYVYWYDFEHERRPSWEYNLTYKFEKKEYEEALWKLWNLAKVQHISRQEQQDGGDDYGWTF